MARGMRRCASARRSAILLRTCMDSHCTWQAWDRAGTVPERFQVIGKPVSHPTDGNAGAAHATVGEFKGTAVQTTVLEEHGKVPSPELSQRFHSQARRPAWNSTDGARWA